MKRSGIDVTSTALLDAIACDLGRAAAAIAAAESKARKLGLKNTVMEMKTMWKDLVRSGKIIERHKANATALPPQRSGGSQQQIVGNSVGGQ